MAAAGFEKHLPDIDVELIVLDSDGTSLGEITEMSLGCIVGVKPGSSTLGRSFVEEGRDGPNVILGSRQCLDSECHPDSGSFNSARSS